MRRCKRQPTMGRPSFHVASTNARCGKEHSHRKGLIEWKRHSPQSMKFRVVREEEDDSGTSRQITISWSIPRFREVFSKLKPKQRLKSPPFQVFNCSGFDVSGAVVFVPKGLAATASSPRRDDGSEPPAIVDPILGVELVHAARGGTVSSSVSSTRPRRKKRIATAIACEVEAFTDDSSQSSGADHPSGDDDSSDALAVSLGSCVEVEVMKKTVDRDGSAIATSEGHRQQHQALPSWPSATPDDTIVIPNALSAAQLQRVSQVLTLCVKVTFLSHADDISDSSEDFAQHEDADDRNRTERTAVGRAMGSTESSTTSTGLFSQVLQRGQGVWSALLNDSVPAQQTNAPGQPSATPTADRSAEGEGAVEDGPVAEHQLVQQRPASSSAAATASALVAEAAERFGFLDASPRQGGSTEFSLEWGPLTEMFCSDHEGPYAWRGVGAGPWSVLVHCICDLDYVFLRPLPDSWVAASATWTRPSPELAKAMADWCPPLRQKVLELVPYHIDVKTFYLAFLSALDTLSRWDPVHEAAKLSRELDGLAGGSSDSDVARTIRDVQQLLSFVLAGGGSGSSDVLPIRTLSRDAVVAQRDVLERLSRSLHRDAQTAGGTATAAAVARDVESATSVLQRCLQEWQREELLSRKSHEETAAKARGICEHGLWSAAARRCLAAASERGVHRVSEVVDEFTMALEVSKALDDAQRPREVSE